MSENTGIMARRRPRPRGRRLRTQPAAALAWGLASFVAISAALIAALDFVPVLRDPEFGVRLQGLRRRLAQQQGRPLVIVLGSSRIGMGLRPDVLAEGPAAAGGTPIVFNHSLVGSGPVMQLMCLDRLLKQGIRPDLVFLEYWPPLFRQDLPNCEEGRIDVNRLNHRDVRLLSHFVARPPALVRRWLQSQLLPFFSHRFILLSHYVPDWLPWGVREDAKWAGIDGLGWLPYRPHLSKAEREERVRRARADYLPLMNSGCLSAKADRALRALLGRLRRERIPVFMLYMPESSEFRTLYTSAMRRDVAAYIVRLHRELEVPTIDASHWLADDKFIDGFHLFPDGARAFTLRFGREVVLPLLQGKQLAAR